MNTHQPPRSRLARAACAAAVVALVGGIAAAPAAQAAPVRALPLVGDCKEPPRSKAPFETFQAWLDPQSAATPPRLTGADRGVGFFETPVDTAKTGKPRAVAGPAENTLASYGWAGFTWPSYDIKYGREGFCTDLRWDARLGNLAANGQLSSLVSVNAAATGLSRQAHDPANYDILNPVMVTLNAGLTRPALWMFFLVALVAGGWMLWTADRRDPRDHATKAAWLIGLAATVTAVAGWQVLLGQSADKALLTAVSWANGQETFDSGAFGESARTEIVVRTWEAGLLGRTSPLVDKYGQSFYFASAISNEEARAAGFDPKVMKDKRDADEKSFRALAEKVKDEDPAAYDVLSGKDWGARVGAGTLGWLTWWWSSSFQPFADAAIVWALFLTRMTLAVWTGLAVVAVIRPKAVGWILSKVLGAALAAIWLTVVVAGSRLAQGGLLTAQNSSNFMWTLIGGLFLWAVSVLFAVPAFRLLFGIPKKWRRKALDELRQRRRGSDRDTTTTTGPAAPDAPAAPGARPVTVTVVPEATPGPVAATVRSVAAGGVTGALSGVAASLVTGGAALPAAAAAAARGAAAAGAATLVTEVTGSGVAGTAAGIAASSTFGTPGQPAPAEQRWDPTVQHVQAVPAPPVAAQAATSGFDPLAGTTGAAPVPVNVTVDDTRYVMPGVAAAPPREALTATPYVPPAAADTATASALPPRVAAYDPAAAGAAPEPTDLSAPATGTVLPPGAPLPDGVKLYVPKET